MRLKPHQYVIALLWLCGIVLIVLLAGIVYLVTPTGWSSSEIRARVVTPAGAPVAGAIIAANWNVEGAWNGASLGQLAISEVVTDKDGWFRIPQWGPKYVWKGAVSESEPVIRIYHPNFVPLIIRNVEGTAMRSASRIIRFRLQDQELVLQPFTGSSFQREAVLENLIRSLGVIFQGGSGCLCNWRDIPRLLIAMQREKDLLERTGSGKTLVYVYRDIRSSERQCGNAEKFFQEFLKNE